MKCFEHIHEVLQLVGTPIIRHIGCFRWFDHIGLVIFYKRDKLSLQSDTSFLLHRRISRCLIDQLHIAPDVCEFLSNQMKEESTYPGIVSPPGCVMATLKNKTSGLEFCVTNVHISWKAFKYPLLQILQVSCTVFY